MLGGTWATDRQFRTVFALGFEVEETEGGVFAVVAILLSGERVVLNTTFNSEDEAHARIRDLAQTLRAVNTCEFTFGRGDRLSIMPRPPRETEGCSVNPISNLRLRQEVLWFAHEMERQLQTHDDTKGKQGWREMSNTELLDEVLREHVELMEAIRSDDRKAIIHEAADLANICMMLADNAWQWPGGMPK